MKNLEIKIIVNRGVVAAVYTADGRIKTDGISVEVIYCDGGEQKNRWEALENNPKYALAL